MLEQNIICTVSTIYHITLQYIVINRIINSYIQKHLSLPNAEYAAFLWQREQVQFDGGDSYYETNKSKNSVFKPLFYCSLFLNRQLNYKPASFSIVLFYFR